LLLWPCSLGGAWQWQWQSGFDVLVRASKWQGCVSLIRKRDRGEKIFTLDEEGENRDVLGCSERN
jgi:hypothetical protein